MSSFRYFPSGAVAAALFSLAVLCSSSRPVLAADPLYEDDLEKAEVNKPPTGCTIISGAFSVKEEGGNHFIELPGAPLDQFGFLFGPAPQGDTTASARFFATKTGRKFPSFAISQNGARGYRLQASPAKKALEIYKGDLAVATVPFEWRSGSWTFLRLQVRKTATGFAADGKAWVEGAPEPAEWAIHFEDTEKAPSGRPGIWASPFSGTPIRIDDLRLESTP